METATSPVPVEEHHNIENGIISQADLFMYKTRECQSAPARAFETQTSASSSRSSSSSSMSNNNNERKRHKRNKLGSTWSWKKVLYFFVCDAHEFTNWTTSFSSTSRIKYLSLFFLETCLRSIGDVTFCSNPLSGLLIFLGMLISSPQVAFLAFVVLIFGIETAVVFLQVPLNEVRSGGVTFNNFLTGTVVALLAREDVMLEIPDIILMCMGVGVLTIIIWKGVNGILASRLEFPLLNLPFHLAILLYMYSGLSQRYEQPLAMKIQESQSLLHTAISNTSTSGISSNSQISFMNMNAVENGTSQMHLYETTSPLPSMNSLAMNNYISESVHWERVFSGILLAPSHVFGTNSISTSLLVHIAVLIYSPLMLIQCLLGAATGTLIGVFLSGAGEYEAVYDGSWAYNPLFTSAALGGFFLIFNLHSFLLALLGGVITTLLYSAMVKLHLPALGIPFMLTTWLLLPSFPTLETESEDPSIQNQGPFYRLRLSQITTPEFHLALLKTRKVSTTDSTEKYKSSPLTSGFIPPSQVNTVLPL